MSIIERLSSFRGKNVLQLVQWPLYRGVLYQRFHCTCIFHVTHAQDGYRWREHKRVAREFEADLQDAEIEDEDDLHFYDDMAQSQPGVLKPEAKLALVRMDSGLADYFGPDDLNSPPHSGPYSGFFDHRLSTITEESQILNPARDNILAFMTPRSRGVADDRGHFLQHSSFDKDPSTEGTLL